MPEMQSPMTLAHYILLAVKLSRQKILVKPNVMTQYQIYYLIYTSQ